MEAQHPTDVFIGISRIIVSATAQQLSVPEMFLLNNDGLSPAMIAFNSNMQL
jgi:hypothetical protein